MLIVQPFDRGAEPVPVRRLTFDERRTLLATLRDQPDTPPALLAEIHEAGNWVACDCRTSPEIPLLHTRQVGSGTIAVVRMHSRPHHAAGCAFAEGLTDHYADSDEAARLEGWLLELMHETGVSRIWEPDGQAEKPSLWSGLKRISEAAATHRNPFGPPAGHLVTTFAGGLPRLAIKLREEAKHRKGKPHGFMFVPAVGATREGLVLRDSRDKLDISVPVRGHIRDYSWAHDEQGHLSLAALLVSAGTDGRYEPTAAVSVPITRFGNPVPTPSRDALAVIRVARKVCRLIAGSSDARMGAYTRFPEGLGSPLKIVVYTTKPSVRSVTIETQAPAQTVDELRPLFLLPPAERPAALRDDDAYAAFLAPALRRRLA